MAQASSSGSMVRCKAQRCKGKEMWFPGPALLLTNVMILGKSAYTCDLSVLVCELRGLGSMPQAKVSDNVVFL